MNIEETLDGLYFLGENIFYEKYGDMVYARDTAAQKDYLFTETAYDYLRHFSKERAVSGESVAELVKKEYAVADDTEFFKDAKGFFEYLIDNRIIVPALNSGKTDKIKTAALIDEVRSYCMEHKILQSVELELTYRCNEKCIHCYVDNFTPDQKELSLSEYKSFLLEVRKMGCLSVLLTGGEVCMKHEWLDIAEFASSIGMLVDIYTNGLALTDEIFDRIRSIHPSSVSYSLYGGTKAVHDAVTGVPGSFDKTIKSIMMTKCAGIDTYIKTVVIKENADDLAPLLKLAERIGVDVNPSYTIFDSYGGKYKGAHMLDTEKDYINVMKICRRYAPEDNIRGRRDIKGKVCRAGLSSLSMDPYGNVYVCISLRRSIGNIRNKSIREIWQHSEYLSKIRSLRFCDLCHKSAECLYKDNCSICFARIDLDNIKIPDDICMRARAAWYTQH